MGFTVTVPGHPVVDDLDFTLDDMDVIERESGIPWTIVHPMKNAKVAKAYVRVVYRMHGLDPAEVDSLRQRDMQGWFGHSDVVEDAPERPTRARKGPKPRKPPHSSGSSPTGTSGPPPSADSNA